MKHFRWQIAPDQPGPTADLARQLRIAPLLARCLVNRGVVTAAAAEPFLAPRLRQLRDPFLIPGMRAAVARLWQARETGETTLIFGDYDVDGVTSTVMLTEVLTTLGWRVGWYLPHRADEGYGLSRDGVEGALRKTPASLILAVDCGTTAVETIRELAARGVEVVVLDHHQPGPELPPAVALVNPHVTSEGGGEFTELCSAGLAFKLAHALVKQGREAGLPGAADFDLRPLLDLAALGTIADLVPLTGENRILAAAGLERLNATIRPGLVALKEVAQVASPLGVHEVGFQLGPRLNAAGRLETAEESVRLLLARDAREADPLARSLDARNRERQGIERAIVEEATSAIRASFQPARDFVIVEARPDWHLGVVGIVASRVVQQFYRPTIIAGGDGVVLRGSGRSIAGFDLAAALRSCDDLLMRHGGHAMAAGVTVAPQNLAAFRERLNAIARDSLGAADLQPLLRLDARVRLADLQFESLADFDRLKPCGMGNPSVQLSAAGLRCQKPSQVMGAGRQHLKLWVTDGTTTHEAVWWSGAEETQPEGAFDLAFAPQVNEYKGRRSIQLKVLDWRPAVPSPP